MKYYIYENMARTFWDVYDDIKAFGHSEYWFKGGRGSTKSSFISLCIIMGILRDPEANAIIYRKVGNTVKDSVYAQIAWAVDKLGLNRYFIFRKNPMEIIYSTGQRIMFRGADDPLKSKSIKLEKGYFKYLWFEELSEFRGMEDIRSIRQSVLRGTDRAITFYSYNPPRSALSWVNGEALSGDTTRLIHQSTYLDVPPEWLGAQFIDIAESLKRTNPKAYQNEYLGVVTGTGGNVFENVETRRITDEEIKALDWFYQGIDWGWFPDPFQWVRCGYDSTRRALYIVDEYRANKKSNQETYEALRSRLTPEESLICDSAEIKSIADYRDYGCVWARGANKAVIGGKGSVSYSMKWLASLSHIIIDPDRCPHSAKEFIEYEFQKNAQGEFIDGYVDANNHAIDAVRYAMSTVWRRGGE